MISGRLEPDGRDVVSITVAGLTLDAVIDTGYDGGVTLPDSLAHVLNLRIRGQDWYQLGDGTQILATVYESEIELGGDLYPAEVLYSTGDEVLLGTEVLRNFRLAIDYPAGTVRLERPAP
jgi:clan AA aspartic protease